MCEARRLAIFAPPLHVPHPLRRRQRLLDMLPARLDRVHLLPRRPHGLPHPALDQPHRPLTCCLPPLPRGPLPHPPVHEPVHRHHPSVVRHSTSPRPLDRLPERLLPALVALLPQPCRSERPRDRHRIRRKHGSPFGAIAAPPSRIGRSTRSSGPETRCAGSAGCDPRRDPAPSPSPARAASRTPSVGQRPPLHRPPRHLDGHFREPAERPVDHAPEGVLLRHPARPAPRRTPSLPAAHPRRELSSSAMGSPTARLRSRVVTSTLRPAAREQLGEALLAHAVEDEQRRPFQRFERDARGRRDVRDGRARGQVGDDPGRVLGGGSSRAGSSRRAGGLGEDPEDAARVGAGVGRARQAYSRASAAPCRRRRDPTRRPGRWRSACSSAGTRRGAAAPPSARRSGGAAAGSLGVASSSLGNDLDAWARRDGPLRSEIRDSARLDVSSSRSRSRSGRRPSGVGESGLSAALRALPPPISSPRPAATSPRTAASISMLNRAATTLATASAFAASPTPPPRATTSTSACRRASTRSIGLTSFAESSRTASATSSCVLHRAASSSRAGPGCGAAPSS